MLGLRTTLAVLTLASCGKGEVVIEAVPIDAMPVKAVEAYRALTGTWSGSMNIKSLGVVTGLVSVDPSGNGTFFGWWISPGCRQMGKGSICYL